MSDEKESCCEHNEFNATVVTNRVLDENTKELVRFNVELKVWCSQCGMSLRFLGLPAGLDLDGASVSLDASEVRLAALPADRVYSELEGTPHGFTIRKER